MLDHMIADLDDQSIIISGLRRQVDRAFADWYEQKKNIDAWVEEHGFEAPSYRESHFFSKKQLKPDYKRPRED